MNWKFQSMISVRLIMFIVLIFPAFYAGSADTTQDYRIGPGDMLSVTVFGEEDLSLKRVRVSTNGSISLALLGEVNVSGFTAGELESELIRRLKEGYLKKPVVTVSVLEYRLFYVNGEVNSPGGYNYVNGLTVKKAIALAGGLNKVADKDKIKLEHEGKPGVLRIVNYDTIVRPGDVITVEGSLLFYVNGEVRSPGGYNYQDGLTVQKAIALAGGLTERASKEKITLLEEGKSEAAKKANFSSPVNPGDVINIDESFFFYVNGEVRRPGGYNYIEGLTVQKAVTLAGGFTERASKQKIIIEQESEPGSTKKASLNTEVSAGDIITVGESFF